MTKNIIKNLQDIRQTPEYAHFMEKIGWKVEIIRSTSEESSAFGGATSEVTLSEVERDSSEVKEIKTINIFIRKLPLLPFSILKILRYHPPLQETEFTKLIKKHHVFLIKLQPFFLDTSRHPEFISGSQKILKQVQHDNSPLIPTKTIWLDLTQSEEQLLKQMKPKTRYNIRKAIKNFLKTPPRWPNGLLGGGRIKIISGNKITYQQLKEFHRLWSKNKPFNFLFKPSLYELKSLVESFGRKCFFVMVFGCHSESRRFGGAKNLAKRYLLRSFQSLDPSLSLRMTKELLLASCLILISKNVASYWHNFSSPEAKKLFAPTLYVWQAIKEAKRRKLKVFDLEGVWDERLPKLNQGWKGFSRFKESFGGGIISFAWPKQSFRFV